MNTFGVWVFVMAATSSAGALQGLNSHFSRISMVSRKSLRLFESKEGEIAKLEEQLRKLKEEKQTEGMVVSTAPSTEDKLEDAPLEMFLTEQWKVQEASADQQASGGSSLMKIVYALGAILVIFLFSQIPIGQEDLSKYSVGSSPVTEQIDLGDLNRARRSGDL